MDELLTTKEVAEMLGIKEQSLHVRLLRGRPPFPVERHQGKALSFRKSDVKNFLTRRDGCGY